MSSHKFEKDDLIIDLSNGERGIILVQLPPQGQGPNRYILKPNPRQGRPVARPGRPIIPPGLDKPAKNTDETPLRPGMNPAETIAADDLLVIHVGLFSAQGLIDLRAEKEVIQDDPLATDHEITEAERYLVALDIIEA